MTKTAASLTSPRETPDHWPIAGLLYDAFIWFDQGKNAGWEASGWPKLTRLQTLLFANLDADGRRSNELAAMLGVSRQAVHVMVRELQAMGFVKLVADPRNRSAKLVRRTEKGIELLMTARSIFEKMEIELGRRIGSDCVAKLREVLEADWGTAFTPTDKGKQPGGIAR